MTWTEWAAGMVSLRKRFDVSHQSTVESEREGEMLLIVRSKRREVWSPCVGTRRWHFGRITIRAAYVRH